MPIDQETVKRFVHQLPGLDVLEVPTTFFAFYDPLRDTPHDRRQPFLTIVSADDHDSASALHRPGVFRVNVGVGREQYRARFGPEPAWNLSGGPVATGHDFAALDVIMPHPVYAPLSWVCILNPSEARWPEVQALILTAHGLAVQAYRRRRGEADGS